MGRCVRDARRQPRPQPGDGGACVGSAAPQRCADHDGRPGLGRYPIARERKDRHARVEIGDERLEGAVEKAHDPAPIPSPDRVPRGEVYKKLWCPLPLGTVRLAPGQRRLVLRAVEIPGPQAPDIKAVQLRWLGDA